MANLKRKSIKLGIENLLEKDLKLLSNQRVGLICNQASVNHRFQHAADLFFDESKINLTTLFGPQHGIRGDVQDNMIETAHTIDKQTGVPVYSLYSETREPTDEMLRNIDVLVFDLQDIGGRVYTFIYTMANAMKSCARNGKKFVVLDRPNPIGGIAIEGNILEIGHESFVGQYPIPMRHGMTVGELAEMFNCEFAINCDLQVIKMENWSRDDFYDETDAPWVMPSPNIPTVDSTVVFPATVYLEGTQISEGRGTTRPFEIIGAPFINSKDLAQSLELLDLPGVIFRPVDFLPTFQKYSGEVCGGVFLHITDRLTFEPVYSGLALIKTIFDMYPNDFSWKKTPYEYVFDRNPFDVIAGTTKIREMFEKKVDFAELRKFCKNGLNDFASIREKFLLY